MVKCAKCGQEKNESEGKYVLEGSAFYCNDCKDKEDTNEKGEVCEFC